MPQYLLTHRHAGNQAALIFIHGFTGRIGKTWGDFPSFVVDDPALESWDVFSVGYPSGRCFDLPGIWAADPDIAVLAKGLSTTLSLEPFSNYRSLVLAAHSMGGLVAQRALLDDAALTGKVGHLILFGTPSAGLEKARLGGWWKPQIRDMAKDHSFIVGLSADRKRWFEGPPSFSLHAVAGNRDVFVPTESSLDPFPKHCQDVIDGDHLGIVKPGGPSDKGVQIVKRVLSGKGVAPSAADGAKIAVELRDFQKAVNVLLPQKGQLDEQAAIDLALALDGLNRGAEALGVLENAGRSSTDAKGVLAGRIKRRWLLERRRDDWVRARDLYAAALEAAEAAGDSVQAYYHAINVAFLDLVATIGSGASGAVMEMARRALVHCEASPESHWRSATEGEAALILGDLKGAVQHYKTAVGLTRSPREISSMWLQAMEVADRLHGEAGAAKIAAIFDPETVEA